MRRHPFTLALVALLAPLLLSACATLPAEVAPAAAAPLPGGMVSAADRRAADAGAQMLREGGNAVDAALATLVALTVVEPQSSGIGGGGFLLYDPGTGIPLAYDGRETAPAAATPEWFMRDGQPMGGEARPGGRSTGVPGNLAMMALAHQRHGRLGWARLFAPAIRLAREGFAITPRLRDALASAERFGAFSAQGRELFYDVAGAPLPVGTRVKNPALAEFLERLAQEGPEAFYAGDNAEKIVAAVRGAQENPAPMALADLADYRARLRAPVCGSYRGYRICGMGPPSSGATTVYATLKQLERFDMAALGPGDPLAWHLFAELMRLAFADRALWLADPDFVAVPAEGLTDPAYLAGRAELIRPDTAMAAPEPGRPPGAEDMFARHRGPDRSGTSHFVAVDAAGGIASLTSTIEGAFGSGLMVNGYYLNNELTDFSFVPQVDGRPVANRVEGGKRPRSSMSPTIVYAPNGTFRLAVGAAGGATIIAQVAKVIIGVIDWDLSAQAAIALPVMFAPGETLFVEQGTALEAMIPAFERLGHADVRVISGRFKANAVELVDGRLVGASDPRSEGAAVRP